MKPLYKSTIVIWSDFDPETVELSDLALDAMCGGSYCSKMVAEHVVNPDNDPDWDGSEFFGVEDEEGNDSSSTSDDT
jgi:hypothetical protein